MHLPPHDAFPPLAPTNSELAAFLKKRYHPTAFKAFLREHMPSHLAAILRPYEIAKVKSRDKADLIRRIKRIKS